MHIHVLILHTYILHTCTYAHMMYMYWSINFNTDADQPDTKRQKIKDKNDGNLCSYVFTLIGYTYCIM